MTYKDLDWQPIKNGRSRFAYHEGVYFYCNYCYVRKGWYAAASLGEESRSDYNHIYKTLQSCKKKVFDLGIQLVMDTYIGAQSVAMVYCPEIVDAA